MGRISMDLGEHPNPFVGTRIRTNLPGHCDSTTFNCITTIHAGPCALPSAVPPFSPRTWARFHLDDSELLHGEYHTGGLGCMRVVLAVVVGGATVVVVAAT